MAVFVLITIWLTVIVRVLPPERFERARARLIEKWQQQNQRDEEGAVGAG